MEETQNVEVKKNYLFGIRPVQEAVLAGKEIEKVMFKQGLESPMFRELLSLLESKGIPCSFVPVERLNRVTKGSHQGVIAVIAKLNYVPLEEMVDRALMTKRAPIFVLLDGVSDVRNLGAIARSAECAGASGIIVPAKGGAAINADGIKASAGALLRIDTARVQNLRIAIYHLKQNGFQIVGASEKTDTFLSDIDLTLPTAIVMGSEGKGISSSVLTLCDTLGKIPMVGDIGSLNVSVAASIFLYEATRQRSLK